jgi:ABC-type multidrug transport system ATPase subunit/pSer/pThr/pTyr-binding forkhead associated (FHA) protein
MKIGFVHKGKLIKKIRFTQNVPQEIIIGRSSSVDLSMPELTILSSKHVQLFYDGGSKLHITDLNSSNGTFVNNARITPLKTVALSHRDEIFLAGSNGVKLIFNPDEYNNASGSSSGMSDIENQSVDNIIEKLNRKGVITLGRGSNCDVTLDYSFISREHATIEQRGQNKYVITDLGSLNGTFINGKRVKKAEFTHDDVIYLGRLKLTLKGQIRDLSNEVAIRVDRIVKRYSNDKFGLHETSFEIPAKSLLAIMGPSGCGKTTLLRVLIGHLPVTSGKVYIGGLELNKNFDLLKMQIGYVPQDDIVHRELTVEQTLKYAAKLRLNNVSQEQIEEKIDSVLKNLNIQNTKTQKIEQISGGQRKRVSIAVELLTDPMILFLDEPTSPLDPETIENFLESIQALSRNGTTVVMVTHKPEDLSYMQSVIFMADGGHMVYYDNAESYLNYFNVKNAPKVYSNLVGSNAEKWVTKFKQSHPVKPNTDSKPQSIKSSPTTNYLSQYFWLTRRYFNIKLNDRLNSAFMVGQAPLIAILILIIFSNISMAVPFLLTISALWFGVNNAAREIVAEAPIYKRERMFNQGILPYVLSKLTVLTTFAMVQCFIFTVFLYFGYSTCKQDEACVTWANPALSFVWMLFVSIVGTLMGLLLSAIVTTTEKVMTLVPMVLIPQLMLAGIITKIDKFLVEIISYFTISRWGTEGFSIIQKEVIVDAPGLPGPNGEQPEPIATKVNAIENLMKNFHDDYETKKIFGEITGHLRLDILALSIMSLLLFAALYIALKRKDPIAISK